MAARIPEDIPALRTHPNPCSFDPHSCTFTEDFHIFLEPDLSSEFQSCIFFLIEV